MPYPFFLFGWRLALENCPCLEGRWCAYGANAVVLTTACHHAWVVGGLLTFGGEIGKGQGGTLLAPAGRCCTPLPSTCVFLCLYTYLYLQGGVPAAT